MNIYTLPQLAEIIHNKTDCHCKVEGSQIYVDVGGGRTIALLIPYYQMRVRGGELGLSMKELSELIADVWKVMSA